MIDTEFDWRASEDEYWAQYGPLGVQNFRMQRQFKRERRAEMSLFGHAIDWLFEQLFPRRYYLFNYTVWERPLMRLIYKDGTPSNLMVRAPLPRFHSTGNNVPVTVCGRRGN
jgi:hypothetical protein